MTWQSFNKPIFPVIQLDHPLAKSCVGAWAHVRGVTAGIGANLGGGDWSGQRNYLSNNSSNQAIDRGAVAANFASAATNFEKVDHSTSINVGGLGDSYTMAVLFRTFGQLVNDSGIYEKRVTAGGPYPLRLVVFNHLANFSVSDGTNFPNPIGGVIDDSAPHRIVCVVDGTRNTVATYQDGVLAASVNNTITSTSANTEALFFGSGRAGLTGFFDGAIYEVRLCRQVWTPGMVAADWLDPFAIYRGGPSDYLARRRGKGPTNSKANNKGAFPGPGSSGVTNQGVLQPTM